MIICIYNWYSICVGISNMTRYTWFQLLTLSWTSESRNQTASDKIDCIPWSPYSLRPSYSSWLSNEGLPDVSSYDTCHGLTSHGEVIVWTASKIWRNSEKCFEYSCWILFCELIDISTPKNKGVCSSSIVLFIHSTIHLISSSNILMTLLSAYFSGVFFFGFTALDFLHGFFLMLIYLSWDGLCKAPMILDHLISPQCLILLLDYTWLYFSPQIP